MLREHIVPQPGVIRAVLLEGSPCGGVPAPCRARPASPPRYGPDLKGTQTEVIRAI